MLIAKKMGKCKLVPWTGTAAGAPIGATALAAKRAITAWPP
jgi:hypothetical protein